MRSKSAASANVPGWLCAPICVQTDRLIVFHDIYPAAAAHLLVVPLRHINHCGSLRPSEEHYALGEACRHLGACLGFRETAVMSWCCLPVLKFL